VNNTNTNLNLSIKDAQFVLRLIENGEYDRALSWSYILTDSIKSVMRENNITPSRMYINGVEVLR